MEAFIVEDLNINYVELSRGKYLIDDKPVTITSNNEKISVESFDNIRKVTESKVIAYYLLDDVAVSVNDFTDKKLQLLSKRTVDEDGYESWNSLEDEYEFKKFNLTHQTVYNVEETISEPLTFSPQKRTIETGNQYIVSQFSQGINTDLFTYNRESAFIGIVHETMKSLGMTYNEKTDYGQTSHKKIYGNSNHSCIRYVTAFGSYVFDDSFDCKGYRRGTLESMKAMFAADEKLIKERIITKYTTHFGTVDKDSFDFQGLLKEVETALNYVRSIGYTKKGYSSWQSAVAKLLVVKKQIEQSFEVKE